jgi:hypothetical protein
MDFPFNLSKGNLSCYLLLPLPSLIFIIFFSPPTTQRPLYFEPLVGFPGGAIHKTNLVTAPSQDLGDILP